MQNDWRCQLKIMSAKKKETKKKSKDLLLVTESGLTQAELQASAIIAAQVPEMVAGFNAYRQAEGEFKARFWELAETLRKPVVLKGPSGPLPEHRLNGREVTLLLLGLGEIKQRVTEWKRVVEMDDALFAKCRELALSKIDTLKLARGSAVLDEKTGEVKGLTDGGKKTDPVTLKVASFHKLKKSIQELLHSMMAENPDAPEATDDDTPYELSGATADGRDYLIRIFVDSIPTKPEKK